MKSTDLKTRSPPLQKGSSEFMFSVVRPRSSCDRELMSIRRRSADFHCVFPRILFHQKQKSQLATRSRWMQVRLESLTLEPHLHVQEVLVAMHYLHCINPAVPKYYIRRDGIELQSWRHMLRSVILDIAGQHRSRCQLVAATSFGEPRLVRS